jgi:hypothetical protein
MPADRLPDAIDYAKQDFWPLPCKKDEKESAIKWAHLHRRPMTAQERHDGWPNRSDRNIALICGRRAGLLVLNINVKRGHDGHATIKRLGWHIPQTPTIATPSGGLAICFQPPDPHDFPFPFKTYVHPEGYDGLEFRGGDDHYQLFPPSRTAEGVYAFVPPWTIDQLRQDLADLPDCILQAWYLLDCGGEHFSRRARHHQHNSESRTTLASAPPTDLSPQPTLPRRSQARPPLPRDLSSGAPVLLETYPTTKRLNPHSIRRLFGDWDANAAAAQFLGLGRPPLNLLCFYHPDCTPSMSLYVDKRTRAWKIHDWHKDGSPKGTHYSLADIFAARILGYPVRLKGKPTLATWWKRLLLACKYLEAPDVPRKALPTDARDSVQQVYEGFLLNVQCHWLTQPGCAVPFTHGFAMAWCGMHSKKIVEYALYRLQRDGQMRPAGRQHGSQVFLPGKD